MRAHPLWLVPLGLLLAAPAAAAPSLGEAQWRGLYDDLGNLALPGPVGVHYSADWDRGIATVDNVLLDAVDRDDPQPRWKGVIDPERLPRVFHSLGVGGWYGLSERWRLGGSAGYLPRLTVFSGSIDALFQILSGTTERSAFFVGAGLAYQQRPDWYQLLEPHLFLEWSSEILRSEARGHEPWIFYLVARLDQGYRFALPLASEVVRDNEFMPTWIRGSARIRRGPFLFAYTFGGHQPAAFTHGFTLSWIFTASEGDGRPAPAARDARN